MSPQRLGFLVCLLAVFCLGFTSPAQSGSVTVNMSPVALSDPLVSTLLSSSLGGWDPASLPNNLAARTAGGLVYDSTGQAFSSMLSASTIFPPFGFFSLLEMYSGAPLYSPSQVAGGWFMKSPVNEDIFDVNGNVKVDSLVVQMNGLNLLQVMDPTTFVVAPMTPALGFPAASLNVTYPYQNPFSNPWLFLSFERGGCRPQ